MPEPVFVGFDEQVVESFGCSRATRRITSMNRREFLATTGQAVGGAMFWHAFPEQRTSSRPGISSGSSTEAVPERQDWYNNPQLSPNFARLAHEAFVYEESYNDSIANHRRAWMETITGNPSPGVYPTPAHYVRQAFADEAIRYWFINPGDDEDILPAATRPISLNTARIDDLSMATVSDREKRLSKNSSMRRARQNSGSSI